MPKEIKPGTIGGATTGDDGGQTGDGKGGYLSGQGGDPGGTTDTTDGGSE